MTTTTIPKETETKHKELEDPNCNLPTRNEDINLDIQNADESVLRKTKEALSKALKETDLTVNINKKEEYVIHRNGDEKREQCNS